MATQDLIEFTEDDGEDDDVQAILAALQTRKEKQQKLKKAIRDRATRSQKQLKDDSEADDAVTMNVLSRMRGCENELRGLQEKSITLAPIPPADTREDHEELAAARQTLQDLGKQALEQAMEVEKRFNKRMQKVTALLDSEMERSQNGDVVQALHELSHEIEQAVELLQAKRV